MIEVLVTFSDGTKRILLVGSTDFDEAVKRVYNAFSHRIELMLPFVTSVQFWDKVSSKDIIGSIIDKNAELMDSWRRAHETEILRFRKRRSKERFYLKELL